MIDPESVFEMCESDSPGGSREAPPDGRYCASANLQESEKSGQQNQGVQPVLKPSAFVIVKV